jgi:hypothetical protein
MMASDNLIPEHSGLLREVRASIVSVLVVQFLVWIGALGP